jgi:3',5'-cyclic AMP phosphodiesterase CpdA
MTTLLQISDPHFGTEQKRVVEAVLDLARREAPDLVILSGDITQRARRDQFRAARAFVDRLAPRALLAIPGNHDIPLFNLAARLFSPYANFAQTFGRDLEPVFDTKQLLVIGVNSTRAGRHKHGEVSATQIDLVAQRLQRAPTSALRLVVVHHPVLAIRTSDTVNLLRGHQQAVPIWAAAGADIIMGGHIHLPYVRSLRAMFPSLAREVWTVQAGTAVSSRVRDGMPNSINVLRCESSPLARHCIVERWDYSAISESFERHREQTLTFDSA